jgi:hypothetical protein
MSSHLRRAIFRLTAYGWWINTWYVWMVRVGVDWCGWVWVGVWVCGCRCWGRCRYVGVCTPSLRIIRNGLSVNVVRDFPIKGLWVVDKYVVWVWMGVNGCGWVWVCGYVGVGVGVGVARVYAVPSNHLQRTFRGIVVTSTPSDFPINGLWVWINAWYVRCMTFRGFVVTSTPGDFPIDGR